jgi:hypothetical protein
MKLYRARVPLIAKAVIDRLTAENDIEVAPESRIEAEQDLIAIMESFLKRDLDLREAVRETMSRKAIPYDQYSKIRNDISEAWGHPSGDSVQKYLSRQFVENFMISRWIDEVYSDDELIFRKILDTVRSFDVDENALRIEAQERVKNITPGSVDYEIAFAQALKEVRKKHGLL